MAKRTGGRPSAEKRGSYVPDMGDLAWLSFSPQAGKEQAGHRPALVLSPRVYNERTGLCVVCPITSQAKGYPFEVELPANLPVQGVVLSDHVRSTDWRQRAAEYIAAAPMEVVVDVRTKLLPLLGPEPPVQSATGPS